MERFQQISIFLLRISLGWMYFWAGITKVFNPEWSAAGYLQKAKTFPEFFQWLTTRSLLPSVNFLNEWGLTLLGVALILGVFVRVSSSLGMMLMLLYYLPILQFPHPNPNSFLVDQHIIFIVALLVLISFRAGRTWGLENWCSSLPICSKFPKLRAWLG